MPKIVDHEQQRHELSETVVEVIANAGLENTTLRTVASYHGCTKGMVQHYFSDKDQLLIAAVCFVEDRFANLTQQAAEGLVGLDQLAAGLAAQLPSNVDVSRDWLVRIIFQTRPAVSRQFDEAVQQYRDDFDSWVMKALRQAQRSGELQTGISVRNSCRSITATLWGISLLSLSENLSVPASAQRQILQTSLDNLRG
jgi:AcrR family transcriptional regulator